MSSDLLSDTAKELEVNRQYIEREALGMLRLATSMGIVVTIERVSMKPFAMGNTEYKISTSEKRR